MVMILGTLRKQAETPLLQREKALTPRKRPGLAAEANHQAPIAKTDSPVKPAPFVWLAPRSRPIPTENVAADRARILI